MGPREWLQDRESSIVGLLQGLIRAVEPVSRQMSSERCGSTTRLGPDACEVLVQFLNSRGLETRRLLESSFPVAPVVASVRGRDEGRMLLFNTHLDVVPIIDPSVWTRAPTGGDVVDGLVFGRGACDARGSVAAMASALWYLSEHRSEFRGDVVLHAVTDEETGGAESKALVRALDRVPDGAVNGEPTSLAICLASRGAWYGEIEVTGREAHSGVAFEGINAVELGMKYIRGLRELEKELDRSSPHPLWSKFPVQHVFNIIIVDGGKTPGMVPRKCTVGFTAGCVAGETLDVLRAAVEEKIQAVTCTDPWLVEHPPVIRWSDIRFEPCATASDDPFAAQAISVFREVFARDPLTQAFSGGADFRYLVQAGIPSIVFGPGELRKAHSFDEFVPIVEVLEAAEFLVQLALGSFR